MSVAAVLAPLFAQVALSFLLLAWQGYLRVGLVRSGAVRMRDIALGEPNWPPDATKAANAFSNQFELPVLFYMAVVVAIVVSAASTAFVVLCWLFVATRVVHAAIHLTDNNVPRRSFAYTAGYVVLVVIWIMLFTGVLRA